MEVDDLEEVPEQNEKAPITRGWNWTQVARTWTTRTEAEGETKTGDGET
jgi:hypothetical protein